LPETADRRLISDILNGLASKTPRNAWVTFLECYGPVIFQVIRLFESDSDEVSECFLFTCEELSRDTFRRLRTFDVSGPASFVTWLRVVVRRLCVDRHRKEFGRRRVFDSIARLSELDRAVFRAIYQERMPVGEAFAFLRMRMPDLTEHEFSSSIDRIQNSLTARQMFLACARRPRLQSLEELLESEAREATDQIRYTGPDPESLAVAGQRRSKLAEALAAIGVPERLLIRLRYEEELTLEQIARLSGLPDAQTVDRRIKQVLAALRKTLEKKPGWVRVSRQGQ
jgi:RNA polymerase sigma factor (sigma-70 family)